MSRTPLKQQVQIKKKKSQHLGEKKMEKTNIYTPK